MDIAEIRHRNFVALIDGLTNAGVTKRAEQAAYLGGNFSASYVSQLLGGKYMGDDVARKISIAMGYDNGWMDRPQWEEGEIFIPVAESATDNGYRVALLDAEAAMGDGAVNNDYPDVVREIDFDPAYIRALLGFVPKPGRLKLVTGRGDSMLPTIQPGDVVLVDTGCESFQGDGLYLINSGNGQQIKRLHDRGGTLYVFSDNPIYPAEPVNESTLIGGKVYLHNRLTRVG